MLHLHTSRILYDHMTKATERYVISFPRPKAKKGRRKLFIELARRHIVKGKRGGDPDLSKKVDEIAYGI